MRKITLLVVMVTVIVSLISAAPSRAQGNGTYVVQPGDTLFGIAARFNVSVSELATINGIYDVNNVPVGKVLILPPPLGGRPPQSGQGSQPGGGQTSGGQSNVVISNLPPGTTVTRTVRVTYYVVKQGDNLSSIAARFRTTAQAILAANGLSNPNLIYVGQQLVIPQPTVTTGKKVVRGRVYIVQPGDNLFGIARKFKRDIYAIARANGLLNLNAIYVGQALIIP